MSTSDLQKEAAKSKSMATRYLAIHKMFDAMPSEFKLLDLMKCAGLRDGPVQRGVVAEVLRRDFKCRNAHSVWKKS